MTKINWSRIQTFSQIDAQYDMLVRRMQNFDDQAQKGTLPKKTLTTFVHQLREYLRILDNEKKLIEKQIKKAKGYKDTSALGVIVLNKKKIELIISQLSSTYTKWSYQLDTYSIGKKKNENEREGEKFGSLEEIITTKQLIEQMNVLIRKSQYLQKETGIVVNLNNIVEAEIEKEDGFLLVEYDFLTNVVNMLTKVHEFMQNKSALCTSTLRSLRKTWKQSFSRERYDIKHPLFKNEEFKKEYTSFIRAGNAWLSLGREIASIQAYIELLSENKDLYAYMKTINKQTKKILKSDSIHEIHTGYTHIEKQYELAEKVETHALLVYNPFLEFNKELILSKFSDKKIMLLKQAKKLGEKHNQLQNTRTILFSKFIYPSKFQKSTISAIISEYFSHIGGLNLLSYRPNEIRKDSFEASINDYNIYLSQESHKIRKVLNKKEHIQQAFNDIISSWKNIQEYTYKPFDSLDSLISRLIQLNERTGRFGKIRDKLVKKLEKTYTDQYEYLVRSSGYGSSNRSSKVSGGEIISDVINLLGKGGGGFGGGGRSSGGGSSFSGGGRSSSGGTSW